MNAVRITIALATSLLATAAWGRPLTAQDPHMETARRVLATTPLIDGHNDLPWAIRQSDRAPRDVAAYDLRGRAPGHTDIPRLREGMVGAQFWSVYIPAGSVETGAARMQLEQIDIAKQVFARYPEAFQPATSPDEVLDAFGNGRIASIIGLEGGHAIENSLGTLRAYYELGARYLTLTHGENNDWADSGTDEPEHHGLTEFGREVIREMNRLGMLVDLSHTSIETMNDVLDVTEAPVLFSHSSTRALVDHPRNVPDDVLRRLAANDGVIMITFVPSFIDESVRDWQALPEAERMQTPAPRARLDDVVAHIEHARDVAGVDHIGIGSDFDGITSVPVGLEDVSKYPALFAALSGRGWSEADLRKLAGENLLRAWRQAETIAARLRRERGPSTATIEQLDSGRDEAGPGGSGTRQADGPR